MKIIFNDIIPKPIEISCIKCIRRQEERNKVGLLHLINSAVCFQRASYAYVDGPTRYKFKPLCLDHIKDVPKELLVSLEVGHDEYICQEVLSE